MPIPTPGKFAMTIRGMAGVPTIATMKLSAPHRNIFITRRCVGSRMTIYITLGNLTRGAFEKSENLEERDRKAKQIIESLGGKLISLHYTFGRYDFVLMMDMPSKEIMVKFLAILGKYGTVRTETLETIPAEMIYKIGKEG